MQYVRFESPVPNERGAHPGVFALANGLARSGQLDAADLAWWRANNDWLEQAYTDPGAIDPKLFDRSVNPLVSCWFKSDAQRLLARVPAYLELLARHGFECVERRSANPGAVLYEDDVQVVVAPY